MQKNLPWGLPEKHALILSAETYSPGIGKGLNMVKIVADTTSSISPEEARRLGIAYMPQIIVFGDQNYRDDTEMDTQTFLKRLKTSSSLPKTAAPPPALYTPVYEKLISEGHSILVICPSAEVSGTVRSATLAAKDFPEADIRIIDSRSLGSGLASLVLEANQWANQGLDAETIENKVKEMASREHVYFLVDTLEYLYKGGRIGGASALLGSLLQVKPILTLKDGRAESAETQRTKRRALTRLHELVIEFYPKDGEGFLTIMHGDAEDEAKKLGQDLGDLLGISNIPIYPLPPAVLVHAGPGVLAASCFSSKND